MKSAEEFVKSKRPQDFGDIPKWHFEDMNEYASAREAKLRELCETQKELIKNMDSFFYDTDSEIDELRQRIAELENELL